tara:strand:- start:164 stop:400 length:237 start_codon:yes stop_codon:yes gene_type:complete
MAKTKEEKLGNLFDLVCDDLTSRINSGDATSADLNIARQMLKDNGITAAPVKESPLQALTNALPFPSSDEVSAAKASL